MVAVLFDAVERAQLADLFDELGPEAPTLLERWTTRDLAAHLVLREHDYLAGPGLVLPGAWSRFAERRRRALASRDFTRTVQARPGKPTARIAGPPGELLLYLFGRQDAAQVEVDGSAAAVDVVRRARFSM